MVKRIVYIHPGDMIELRICDADYPAQASEYHQQVYPRSCIIRYDEHGGIEVFDTVTNIVWSGTGSSRQQMLTKPNSL